MVNKKGDYDFPKILTFEVVMTSTHIIRLVLNIKSMHIELLINYCMMWQAIEE